MGHDRGSPDCTKSAAARTRVLSCTSHWIGIAPRPSGKEIRSVGQLIRNSGCVRTDSFPQKAVAEEVQRETSLAARLLTAWLRSASSCRPESRIVTSLPAAISACAHEIPAGPELRQSTFSILLVTRSNCRSCFITGLVPLGTFPQGLKPCPFKTST